MLLLIRPIRSRLIYATRAVMFRAFDRFVRSDYVIGLGRHRPENDPKCNKPREGLGRRGEKESRNFHLTTINEITCNFKLTRPLTSCSLN